MHLHSFDEIASCLAMTIRYLFLIILNEYASVIHCKKTLAQADL